MKQSTVMPLSGLHRGRRGRIHHLEGNGEAMQRLMELGFIAGEYVQVIQNSICGPLIVALSQGKVIIDKALSLSVMVEISE